MKRLVNILLIFLTIYGCVPEQEAIDFGVTITPMSGVDRDMTTREDEPLLVTYEIPVSNEAVNVNLKIINPPQNGSLEKCKYLKPTQIECIYIPKRDYFGKDTIGFKGKDGDFFSEDMSVLELTITPVPDPPVSPKNQNKSGSENSIIKFNVLAGYDVDSTDLKYEIVNSPSVGTLSNCLNNDIDLECTYEPPADFIGDVTFSYKVTDDGGLISENTSEVTITVLNVPEVGEDQEVLVDQYSVVRFDVNRGVDSDTSASKISYIVTQKPGSGKLENCFLSMGNISCSYRPNYGFMGQDSFKYKVIDDHNLESVEEATVIFTVNKVNLAPVAGAMQTITVLQNGNKAFSIIMAKDEDSDNSQLDYVLVTAPPNGVLSNCLAGVGVRSCTYTPNLNFNGVDVMTYKVVDETGISSKALGTIKFSIQKVYQKPVVGLNQKEALVQGTKKQFKVNPGKDVDTDASALKYTVVSSPKKGVLESCFVSKGNLECTYTPGVKETGSDSMSYKIVDDKNLSSQVATVEFNIIAKKYPKVGEKTTISLNQFDVKKFLVNKGTDEDTNEFSLFYKISSHPKNGKLSECFIQVGDLNCVYTPNTNYYGEDSFDYYIEDDYGLKSSLGKVEIVINARSKPVPYPLNEFKTTENTKIDFFVTQAIDADSSATVLKYKLVELPKNGLLKNCFVSTGHYGCEYMPNNKYYGVDEFRYNVTDEKGLVSDTLGVVKIEVTKKLPPIVGADKTFQTKQNLIVKTTVSQGTDDDTEESELQYQIVTKPKYGVLSTCFLLKGIRDCNYTPNLNFYGTDSYTYKIKDKYGLESLETAKVTIKVEQVAVKPKVGADQFFKISKNGFKTFEVNFAIDPDSDQASMSYKVVTPPVNGKLTNCFAAEGLRTCTYTPDQNYYGSDKLTYNVTDSGNLASSNVGTIYFEVIDVNVKPTVGADQTFDIIQGKNITFTVPKGFDKDSADNLLKYFVITNPKEGSLLACFLVAGNKQCTYTPSKFFYGKDSFQYKIKDETGYVSSTTATVTFNVIRRKAPIAQAQSITVKQYSTNNAFVIIPAVDPDSTNVDLTYTVTTQPKSGTLTDCFITKGFTGCKYTPTGTFYGLDSFTYKVVDEYKVQSLVDGKLNIVVEKIDLRPSVGANQSQVLDMNSIATFSVIKGKDADTPDEDLTYKVVTQPTNGVLEECFKGSGNILCKYVPKQYFYGTDKMTYKIVDSTGKESATVATVSFVINKVNIAPTVGANQTISMLINKAKAFTVSSGADLDGQAINLSYLIVSQPKNGILSNCFKGEGVRTCIYTPNAGYYGSDSFLYNVKDLTNLTSQSVAKVTFLVEKKKERPIVGPTITLAVQEGKTLTFSVPLATDADSFAGDLSYRVQVNPSYGSLTKCLSGEGVGIRSCTYTPKPGFNGSDSFSYDVIDESNLASTSRGLVKFNVGGKVYSGEDIFTQGSSEKLKGADIVWVIDNSGSMGNDQTTLRNSFDSFINNFLVNGKARYPFDMFITTTDKKHQTQYFDKLNSTKAESDFSTFKSDFKNAVTVGTRGSGSEKAYESASSFYSSHSGKMGGNDRLAVYIIVSDEREQSSNKNAQQWATEFQNTKDNAGKVRFYNIVDSDSGDRYRDMAAYTGGANFNIKSNFDGILSSIGSAVTSLLDSYILKGGRNVDKNTVTVYVNGILVPKSEWTYGVNSIKFNTPPAPGSTIKITYDYTMTYTGP
ncbi:MAG: hypothetical protein ACJAS4_001564 [Bacteriovoracaceae bacterium]|jgi:hypothetical protein